MPNRVLDVTKRFHRERFFLRGGHGRLLRSGSIKLETRTGSVGLGGQNARNAALAELQFALEHQPTFVVSSTEHTCSPCSPGAVTMGSAATVSYTYTAKRPGVPTTEYRARWRDMLPTLTNCTKSSRRLGLLPVPYSSRTTALRAVQCSTRAFRASSSNPGTSLTTTCIS